MIHYRFACAAFLAFTLTSQLIAQHQYLVPISSDARGERARVLDISSGRAVAQVGGKTRKILSQYYYLDRDSQYADGYLLANQPYASITDHLTHLEFAFGIDVYPDRDYKNCFVVLHLHTTTGQSLFVPKEVGNLKGGKSQRISNKVTLSVPVSQGTYDIYVFCAGEEIYKVPTAVPLKKKNPDPIESRSRGSLSPEIAAHPTNRATLMRDGGFAKGEVKIELAVVDSGYGIDHKVISSSDPKVEDPALDLIKTARFTPGAEDGVYVQKTITVSIEMDGKGGFAMTHLQ